MACEKLQTQDFFRIIEPEDNQRNGFRFVGDDRAETVSPVRQNSYKSIEEGFKTVTTSFEFDSFGQIVSDTHMGDTVTSFNDKLGNRTEMTSLTLENFFQYDNMSRISKFSHDSNFNESFNYTYDGFGRTGKVELKSAGRGRGNWRRLRSFREKSRRGVWNRGHRL